MDNIVIEKVWQDASLLEIKVKASNDFISVIQECYIEDCDLSTISSNALKSIDGGLSEQFYAEFGAKSGNYTPAFSMLLLQEDQLGHVLIEMDMEIADNDSRAHRCLFYVRSDLGSVEEFFKTLATFVDANCRTTELQLHC